MMMNLFSIFDPSLSVFSSSFLVCLLALVLFPSLYWINGNFVIFFSKGFFMGMKEIKYSLHSPSKGVFKFITAIFFSICLYNFYSLFPHVFCMTSHLLTTFPFSYSFWVGIIVFSLVKSFKDFLIHLIPVGTPLGLMSFMVVVELLSNLIRPMALTFRLTANMMAGHLLMSLIGSALLSGSVFILLFGSMLQMLLVFMELGVSVIQAYVFSTLLLLYLSESEH